MFDLPNRLTEKDGELPAQLDRDFCFQEGQKFVNHFRDIAGQLNVQEFEDAHEKYLAQFAAAEFVVQDFKLWFHGKDVLALWLQQPSSRACSVSKRYYCEWAAQNMDWVQYPDLREFQEICWYGNDSVS